MSMPSSVPEGTALAADDLSACRDLLRAGSKSFSAAGLLLPGRIRPPVFALYAFCRVADDDVDEAEVTAEGVATVRARLDRIYAGEPAANAVERAFTEVVVGWRLPRPALELLLEGFEWDATGRRYETLSEVIDYAVRVASTVGVLMTAIMGPRDAETLSRACDLGVAMQLTNIARDVGEDARNGRLYLPRAWFAEAGIEVEAWMANPEFRPEIGQMVARLLEAADGLYRRADQGIGRLPRDCRLAIRAARLIYSAIGPVIERRGFDSVSGRAVTSKGRKLWLLGRALGAAFWRRQSGTPPPLDEAHALISAVAEGSQRESVQAL